MPDDQIIRGVSNGEGAAVAGVNDFSPNSPPGAGGNGGWFESAQGEGVRGWSKTIHHGGVVGVNTASGFGVYGVSSDGIGVVARARPLRAYEVSVAARMEVSSG